jgi:hypothetical protein
MAITNSQKTIIALVVVALIGFGVYYFYFSSPSSDIDSSQDIESAQAGEDIVNLVAELKKVSIDPSLFASPLFSNLKDISIPIYEEVKGRQNPFDPT